MTVFTAAIEHMSGMDIHTSLTQEGLNKKVAAYCRSHWNTISWRSDDPVPEEPEDDEEAIRIYFDDHENDSLTTEASECDDPPGLPTAEAIVALQYVTILSLRNSGVVTSAEVGQARAPVVSHKDLSPSVRAKVIRIRKERWNIT